MIYSGIENVIYWVLGVDIENSLFIFLQPMNMISWIPKIESEKCFVLMFQIPVNS